MSNPRTQLLGDLSFMGGMLLGGYVKVSVFNGKRQITRVP